MSNKTTAEKIAVMQAFLDGKKIEVSVYPGCWGEWTHYVEPIWNWEENNYRIKEEVLPYRRYVAKCVLSGVLFVWTINETNDPLEVERAKTFVRWIDNDWQTV